MKTFPVLLAFCFTTLFSYAQYCGNSGPLICTPTGTMLTPWLTPNEDIPCIVRNQTTNTVVELKNYDIYNFGGQTITVNSIRFDTIDNLPNGLCWATNKANNTFANQEDGCIRISGNTADFSGQYKLNLVITMDIGVPIQTNVDAMGLKLFLRVIDNAAVACPAIDTGQTTPFEPYSGSQNIVQISGKVYYDLNQNNLVDGTDAPAINQLIQLNNGTTTLTGNAGNYSFYTSPGNYSVQPAPNTSIASLSVTPGSINVNAPTSGINYGNNNFAVVIPSAYCLGSLSVVSNTPPPRPGFTNNITVKFKNEVAGSPVSQTIRMFYPGQQSYVSANPSPSLVDTAAKMLEWQTGNVNVGGQWSAVVKFETPPPPTVQNGAILQYSASVVNSSCSSLDTLQTRQFVTVVGSYDPNDKAVSPVGYSDNHAVNPNTVFSYTVRFQNTGTYLAEDVVIVDTISQHLNLATLKVKAASHPYEVAIDNSNRAVKFIFDQIMLPDSFSNEPASHGYIQYSIQPNSNYTNGSIVTNRADIYFDFNPPILTNVVYNTLDDNISSVGTVADDTRFSVFPNPFKEKLEIRIEKAEATDRLEIFDVTGRKVLSEKVLSPQFAVSTAALQAGVYLVKLGSAVKRVVKE